ncbi:hypothetical protein PK35_12540 [Tamlana nanhaiensis]|uniref:DUF6933 domain-containing protein n=1 Tax=Neotamlana nanhaiensis TaxID=1382798 RepID=A0A0D7VZV0_9FLAO|nr:hypothetical protein [Tamlana nanhaiensis]KJD31968.1 hypothetical protein PK35_12540 [Tamlana nanhaiensis]
MTHIFASKKLEKLLQPIITENSLHIERDFGDWYASYLSIAKKKCLVFVNSKTFYTVIIPKFLVKDRNNLNALLIQNLYNQFLIEGYDIDLDTVIDLVGKTHFHPTNNNRRLIGILNHYIGKLNYLKYDYATFNNIVIHEMAQKLNLEPFKQLHWKTPQEAMKALLISIQ